VILFYIFQILFFCFAYFLYSFHSCYFSRLLNFILGWYLNANHENLYLFPTHTNVQNAINKSEMENLYEKNMVKNKRGRKIYDKLMALAPLNRCPFCGIGQVTTLDHYLPKSKFPTFSVLPYNLVACCQDCNKGKLTSYATTKEKQTLHPYYDDFTNEQWLFAEVKQTFPVSVKFFVNPPTHWNSISKTRVETHFNEYGLSKRFSVEASNELANLKEKFVYFSLSSMDIKSTLSQEAIIYYRKHLNSWQTALYQALSESDWYCSGGYDS